MQVQQAMSDGKNQIEHWTIQKILQWSQIYLEKQGLSESPRLDGELLLGAALKCDRMQLYLRFAEEVPSDVRSQYRDLLKRRALGEPVAYILGYKDFWKHRFTVNSSVLIPRPDTESLVETAANLIADLQSRRPASADELRVLDIGTGSGCIGLSLVLECPEITVTGWDFSQAALSVAQANGERLLAQDDRERVRWVFCDALEKLESRAHEPLDSSSGEVYDVVVSNPPYIAPHESSTLSASVLNYEPRIALFADDDGLGFYRAMARGARQLLRPHGFLVVEVGHTQSLPVQALFEELGWITKSVMKDYSKIDRCLVFATAGNHHARAKSVSEGALREAIGYVPLDPPTQPKEKEKKNGEIQVPVKKSSLTEVYYEESILSADEEKLLASHGIEADGEP